MQAEVPAFSKLSHLELGLVTIEVLIGLLQKSPVLKTLVLKVSNLYGINLSNKMKVVMQLWLHCIHTTSMSYIISIYVTNYHIFLLLRIFSLYKSCFDSFFYHYSSGNTYTFRRELEFSCCTRLFDLFSPGSEI
jgi:hypothetical protein